MTKHQSITKLIYQWAVTYTKPYHHWEYAIFILLGLFGGVYGAIFSRLNITWARTVRQGTWVGRHPIIEVLMVSLAARPAHY